MLRTRYRRILFFWATTLLSLTWWELVLPRLGLRGLSRRNRAERLRRHARQFRALAIQLGGVLIKVGQFLSSRVDVMPPEVIEELAGLQDEVPADAFDRIRLVAEAELGAALTEKFAGFESTPLAAASLGQVYRATLREVDIPEGGCAQVVVKIQRPQIEQIIATDLAALRRVGGWVQWYGPIRRRVNISALLDEFTRTLYEEIDYLAEGRNAETFAANFRADPGVRVPHVIWTHTSGRVLTLEDVGAIKISDYEAITAAGIDRAEVAKRLIGTYLKQIFEDGFFHADPHPGNLFVSPLAQGGWQLTFIDFGMVGRVLPTTRQGMRELLIGVGTQDSARVVKSYQMLNFLLPGADYSKIEQAQTKMFERFWGMSMDELRQINTRELTDFAYEFRDLLYTMPFQVPQDLIFLGRCVGILSGMATGLNPNYNVWDELSPFAQKILKEETPSGAMALLTETGDFLKKVVLLPIRLGTLIDKAERGELAVRTPDLTEQVRLVQAAARKMAGAMVFAAMLLGGIQVYLAGFTSFGGALLVGAGVALLWMIFKK
jgi:predicted unusual protein kinase regulating ubiquinone biosynthesis (AarF/ABC1/UbiB family)